MFGFCSIYFNKAIENTWKLLSEKRRELKVSIPERLFVFASR